MTAMSMWCWVEEGGCYSLEEENGRGWGTGPYGDPWCTEQLNALSLFCLLLVVLAAELAHGDRESEREGERAGSQQHAAVFATAMPMAPVHVQ